MTTPNNNVNNNLNNNNLNNHLNLNNGFGFGRFPRIIGIVIGRVNFAAAINNNNNNNINNNNNNDGSNQNTLYSVRARLFRVLFVKIALIYAIAVPPIARRIIEWIVLTIVSGTN